MDEGHDSTFSHCLHGFFRLSEFWKLIYLHFFATNQSGPLIILWNIKLGCMRFNSSCVPFLDFTYIKTNICVFFFTFILGITLIFISLKNK